MPIGGCVAFNIAFDFDFTPILTPAFAGGRLFPHQGLDRDFEVRGCGWWGFMRLAASGIGVDGGVVGGGGLGELLERA